MKRQSFFILLIIISMLLIPGCITPPSLAPGLTTVKVGYQPTSSNGPLYIAKEEGFFAEQGINLELVRVQSTASSLPSLINGDIDATTGPVGIGMVNAVQDGAHIRIVADKGSVRTGQCTPIGLLVRRDLYDKGAVRDVSGLKGRRILSLADKDYDLSRALALGNLTYDDVDVVVMDYASAVVAFRNGAIDAGILTEPYLTQATNSDSAVVLVPAQEYTPQYGIPLFYGPALIDRNPELGRKFMVAYLKGVRQYNEGKTLRNLAIIGNYTGLDEGLLNQSCWYPIAADGIFPTRPVRDYLDWMYANKKISKDMDENQLIDMSYVRYADGVLQNTTSGKGVK
jgi:NitT/TauT family transport system substrate-binding protein